MLLNFAGFKKFTLAKIVKPPNNTIPSSIGSIFNSNISAQFPIKNNMNSAEKDENKVHATSLFPNIVLFETKL